MPGAITPARPARTRGFVRRRRSTIEGMFVSMLVRSLDTASWRSYDSNRQDHGMSEEGREPIRLDGYAPIRDYAAIGDGTAVALGGPHRAVDRFCLPQHDSERVFAALLDPAGGGSCSLRPDEPFRAARRYLPESNVLETTFTTSSGSVRVTDALTLQAGATLPWRELVRRVEGLSGSVPMRWSVGASEHLERGVWTRGAYTDGGELRVLKAGDEQLAVLAWDAGEPVAVDEGGAGGRFEATAGGV